MTIKEFTPKFFTTLREGISRDQLIRDILSGIIVGIVALPLAIAFAIASGVSPEKGIITAIIGGLIISVFGGSRVQIGGPTGAFIVIVYGIVNEHGIQGLTVATFMAGFILIGMGLFRFGRLIKYFPYTLVVGFTTGIAVIIFTSQIRDLFGIQMGQVPADFLDKWNSYFHHLSDINIFALATGGSTILIVVLCSKFYSKIPGSLVAIILCTICVYFFQIPVDTVGSRFGAIPGDIALHGLRWITADILRDLFQPALAIAALGAIESLLSAVVADGMIGGNHRSNIELIAQGGANMFSALFGGIPVTGAIARTATNIKNGGRTPVAGIIHSIVLLLILLAASPFTRYIPMACLAGILVVVSYNMCEMHTFMSIFKTSRYDVAVLLTTFLVTVFFDLIIAIEIGMGLAAILFLKRMSDSVEFGRVISRNGTNRDDVTFEEELDEIPGHTIIYEIYGPLFFGAAQKFFDTVTSIGIQHEYIILRMRNVPMIDATGLQRLRDLVYFMKNRSTEIILSGVNKNVHKALTKTGVDKLVIMQPDIRKAIRYVQDKKMS